MRMRTRMDVRTLAREWASHHLDSGDYRTRRWTGDGLWCRDGVLYSYGEAIARFVAPDRAWISSGKWSITTSRHQHSAVSALDRAGVIVRHVPAVTGSLPANLAALAAVLPGLAKRAPRGDSAEWRFEQALARYATLWGDTASGERHAFPVPDEYRKAADRASEAWVQGAEKRAAKAARARARKDAWRDRPAPHPCSRWLLRTSSNQGVSYSNFEWPIEGWARPRRWSTNPRQSCGDGLHGLLFGEGDWSHLTHNGDGEWRRWQILHVPNRAGLIASDGKVRVREGWVETVPADRVWDRLRELRGDLTFRCACPHECELPPGPLPEDVQFLGRG